MDKRIAQNAYNFLLSDRFTYSGEDALPLVEILRELQAIIGHGIKSNQEDGSVQDTPPGPESAEGI